jgi:hypothetical protein
VFAAHSTSSSSVRPDQPFLTSPETVRPYVGRRWPSVTGGRLEARRPERPQAGQAASDVSDEHHPQAAAANVADPAVQLAGLDGSGSPATIHNIGAPSRGSRNMLGKHRCAPFQEIDNRQHGAPVAALFVEVEPWSDVGTILIRVVRFAEKSPNRKQALRQGRSRRSGGSRRRSRACLEPLQPHQSLNPVQSARRLEVRCLVGLANFQELTWGKTADRLGWTTLDLFGVHPTAPTARFDVMGLIPILRGRSVCVLTEKTATIECESGARLTLYPPTKRAQSLSVQWVEVVA